MYGVSFELETIKEEARAKKVDIVMFGHTHKPHLEYCEDGLVVLNPEVFLIRDRTGENHRIC